MDGNDDDAHGTSFGVDAGLQKTSAKPPSDSVPRERVFGLIQPRRGPRYDLDVRISASPRNANKKCPRERVECLYLRLHPTQGQFHLRARL